MYSAYFIFGLGTVISLVSIVVWYMIIRSQRKQFTADPTNDYVKKRLLFFSISWLCSNFVPIGFYIYRIIQQTEPSNIFYPFIINFYIINIISYVNFYLIYKS